MKKYIRLTIYAEGNYSGATYEESLFLTESVWSAIKEDIEEKEFYIYELDGKHSCCSCSLDVEEFTEEEIIETKIINSDDGYDLYYTVKELMTSNDIKDAENLLKEIEEDIRELSELYPFEDITVKIRKENKERLMEFIKQLQ